MFNERLIVSMKKIIEFVGNSENFSSDETSFVRVLLDIRKRKSCVYSFLKNNIIDIVHAEEYDAHKFDLVYSYLLALKDSGFLCCHDYSCLWNFVFKLNDEERFEPNY